MSDSPWVHSTDEEMNHQGLRRMEQMVQQLARESCPDGACPIEPVLKQCVHDVVCSLWQECRVTSYVPVLTLKRVQDCIRAGTCDLRTAAE